MLKMQPFPSPVTGGFLPFGDMLKNMSDIIQNMSDIFSAFQKPAPPKAFAAFAKSDKKSTFLRHF